MLFLFSQHFFMFAIKYTTWFQVDKLYQINKQQIVLMTTYKEKYEKRKVRKTQLIKPPQKILPQYPKTLTKPQKASRIKTTPVLRPRIQDRHATFPVQKLKDEEQKNNETSNDIIKNQQNENTQTTRIHQRARSVSIVQKFIPSSSYQPLSYPKRGPIDSFEKMKILNSVQNFFARIIRPDNGCICEQPCEWGIEMFKWVDSPEILVTRYYEKLKNEINLRAKKRKQELQYFSSVQQEQKDQQIEKSFKQIRKDVDRTQSESPTFQNPEFRLKLENILKCYVMEDTKIGYVQGMNMILAGILYHVKDEVRSFGIFRKILYSIRGIYLDGFRESYKHVNKIENLMKTHLFDVFIHLGSLQIELHMICLPWILSLLSSIVPLDAIHLIYYGFIKQKWSFIYKIILSIFAYFKDKILFEHDGSEILVLFSATKEEFKEIDWEDIVKYAKNLSIQSNN